MREKILNLLENNGRIDIHDMSVMLGVAQEEVANEIGKRNILSVVIIPLSIGIRQAMRRLQHLLR